MSACSLSQQAQQSRKAAEKSLSTSLTAAAVHDVLRQLGLKGSREAESETSLEIQ